jgi:catechol 2,3-dioxygenase-like lactoylglutathione lyase family enzyme
MRIGIVELFVDDQERALRFYTEVLGLRVVTDASYGEGGRWLTVGAPEAPDGPELLLTVATVAAAGWRAERRASGTPNLSFLTDDCVRDVALLEARGAYVVSPPDRRAYGGTDAVVDDGCGNLLNVHQR